MPSKKELERLHSTRLAVLCQQVANNPSAYAPESAKKAQQLNLKWRRLQIAPDSSLKTKKKIKAQMVTLKERMADFLASIL